MAETNLRFLIVLAVIGLFGIITFALAAATLGTMNKRFKDLNAKLSNTPAPTTISITDTPAPTSSSTSPPRPGALNSTLAEAIQINDTMTHLTQFETIATKNGGTRAVGTLGFEQTVDYIEEYLKGQSYNQFNVVRENVTVQNFSIKGTPILRSTFNNITTNLLYSIVSAQSDFTYVNYTAEQSLKNFILVHVENNGCADSDYINVASRAVLIKLGGNCTSAEKAERAAKNNVSAILFYNHGSSSASLAPATFRLRQANRLPALSLSYVAGEVLRKELMKNTAVTVELEIQREAYAPFHVQNICAYTNHGNQTQTIVIGGHSDSVPAGPGINDNGSGAAAMLALASTLARFYNTTTFAKFPYRIQFCWWAAEEIGLVGAIHHVQQANRTNTPRDFNLSDYLINLNYDMLGSPNYIFGIYNGSSAKSDTPDNARNGSVRISETFRDWFEKQGLPWDYTDFSGRSDYGPFLASGIVAGGLFSGAEEAKSIAQRDRYEQKLGVGRGGLTGAAYDPCYHQACDNTKNIDQFGFLKMTQAAAYMLEFLGRQDNLESWLYPSGRPKFTQLPDDYVPNHDYFRDN